MPHTPFDYLRTIVQGIATEGGWGAAPDLQEWMEGSRLNLLSGLGAGADSDRDELKALQARFFAALGPAFAHYDALAAVATPEEQARMPRPV
jgi:hypothetical protein